VTKLLEAHKGEYAISVLSRKDEQAKRLQELGVTPIRGTLDDFEIIEKAAQEHDARFYYSYFYRVPLTFTLDTIDNHPRCHC
jgi:uncharacterized protein YbjT (DUF2867 family)